MLSDRQYDGVHQVHQATRAGVKSPFTANTQAITCPSDIQNSSYQQHVRQTSRKGSWSR